MKNNFYFHDLIVPTIYVLSVIFLFALSFQPVLVNQVHTPEGLFYYGGDEYPLDLTGNISSVRQGYEGAWGAFYNITTTIPQHTSLLKFEYILIGKFAYLFHLDPLQGLYVARFLLSLTWFLEIYLITTRIFSRKWQQLSAQMIILFGAAFYSSDRVSFVHISTIDIQALYRFTRAMPHYLLGGILSISSLYLFSLVIEHKKKFFLYTLSLFMAAWSSLVYGPNNLIILCSLGFFLLYYFIRWRTRKVTFDEFTRLFILTIFYVFITVLPILYVRYVVAVQLGDFQLNKYVETLNPFSVSIKNYVLAVSFPYILSWFSIITIVKKNQKFLALLYPWVFLQPIALIFFTKYFELNQIRFFLIPYTVVFGILAVAGINGIFELIPSLTEKRKNLVSALIVAVILASSIPTFHYEWKAAHVCYCLFPDFGYPRQSIMEGIFWLRDNTNNSDVVFSDTYAGTLIAPFAGNLVYTSWWYGLSSTYQFYYLVDEMKTFLYGNMTDISVADFLKREKISYVFYSNFDERQLNEYKDELHYPILKKVYENPEVIIYKVN